ncbi:hypothetical protein ACLOAV_003510 [Pseudogymnoascus australis]
MGEIIPVPPAPPMLTDVFDLWRIGRRTLAPVSPSPGRFSPVQHSAASDQHGTETVPPPRTRDSAVLGLSAETVFLPCVERRVNRLNLESALEPVNGETTYEVGGAVLGLW